MDKTSPEYWDKFWETNELPKEINVKKKSVNGYLYSEFDAFFRKHIEADSQKSILELGCGNSVWLPYFYKNFRLNITGLDYSVMGCQRSEYIFKAFNTPGKVLLGDLFSPPQELIGRFDYVVSFGVIEHFLDTVEVLKAHSRYLTNEGKIIVSVPNMHGFPGWYQKVMNREVFDTHVPIDLSYLRVALKNAGFKNIDVQYVLPVAVSAQIDGGKKDSYVTFKKALTLTLSRITKILWAMEIYTGIRFPRSKMFSPAILAYAEK
ncbi:MAG: class I SAM-dependent methyltransferase [Thermaurantimonas sp.]